MDARCALLWSSLSCAVAASLLCSSEALGVSAEFKGSTIVSSPSCCAPELVYKKFPSDVEVLPDGAWQLGFGFAMESSPSSIEVTLRLDPGNPHPDIQLTRDTAFFVEQDGLYHNYDSLERFEILYTGEIDPFVGPVDFLLEPDGLSPIPVRVHLNAIEQSGFPTSLFPSLSVSSPMGDITGNGFLEILVPGRVDAVPGLYAFDHAGDPLEGWPFRIDEPGVIDQTYWTPAIVDLEGDGSSEVIFVGHINANPVFTRSLFAVDGSGQLRWKVDDDFETIAIPAIADLDGDGNLDIVVGARNNLMRLDAGGTPLDGWSVETLNDIHVKVPVIADVDANPGNGLEIVACTPVLGSPTIFELYVWHEDGSLLSDAWPLQVERCQTPTVLNLDLDLSNGLEIVLAFDHADPPVDPESGWLNTFSVLAFHADGSDVNGWPFHQLRDPDGGFVDDRIFGSIAAGDVDGDGDPELVVGTYGQGQPDNGNLFLLHHDGSLDSDWPQWAGFAHSASEWSGPVLGDLDGDGQLEIVTVSLPGVYVFRADGALFPGFPKLTQDNFAQPMIGDLDDDGRLEIVAASVTDVHVWKILASHNDPLPWTRFRQNAKRTGVLPSPAGSVPNGAGVAGVPLTLAKELDGQISLAWGDSCQLGDVDYEIYEGNLGDFASHESVTCSTGGSTSAQLVPAAGGTYYLVVPRNATTEGSYGVTGAGVERAQSANPCLAVSHGACGP